MIFVRVLVMCASVFGRGGGNTVSRDLILVDAIPDELHIHPRE
jgi:hypothetical protein